MITDAEAKRLERIQRTAIHVILGDSYTKYAEALKECNLERLDERRDSLIEKFAVSTAANPKFSHWFKETSPGKRPARCRDNKYKSVVSRTESFRKSAIPRMTEILNERDRIMEEEHNQDDLKCETCNLDFTTNQNLYLHKRFRHGNEDSLLPRWSKRIVV